MKREDYERLRWRCIRRALLELDIALTRFLDQQFDKLSDAEQQAFVELADMEDHDLWHMISGQKECDAPCDAARAEHVQVARAGGVGDAVRAAEPLGAECDPRGRRFT